MHGQCRIGYVNKTQLNLFPYNGNLLTIGGIDYTLPASTIYDTIGKGLTPNTTYYVYAYYDYDKSVQIEFSTTKRATDPATGWPIKTGDSSRTLLGMVRIAFNGDILPSTTAFVGIKNWFNKKPFHLTNGGGVTYANSSYPNYGFCNLLSQMSQYPVGYGGMNADGTAKYVVGNGLPGLIWDYTEESILFGEQGEASCSVSNGTCQVTGGTAADGIFNNNYWSPCQVTTPANVNMNISSAQPFIEIPSREGYHEFTFYGQTYQGTAAFYIVPWLMMTA